MIPLGNISSIGAKVGNTIALYAYEYMSSEQSESYIQDEYQFYGVDTVANGWDRLLYLVITSMD